MIDAHRLLHRYGLEGARARAVTKFDRCCIDAAAVMRDLRGDPESPVFGGIGVMCPPHRDPGTASEWTRRVGSTRYVMRTGRRIDSRFIGLPFGAKARLILLYLHDQAVRQGSATLNLDLTMHGWVRTMTGAIGGMTYRTFAEQAVRIARCRLSWSADGAPSADRRHMPIVTTLQKKRGDGRLATLSVKEAIHRPDSFPDAISLDATFFRHVTADPVALRPSALRLIGDNSWAIDLYLWLSASLPRLDRELVSRWGMLTSDFDLHYATPRLTRVSFLRALQLVLAVYPEARVDVDERGYRLSPSPPPA